MPGAAGAIEVKAKLKSRQVKEAGQAVTFVAKMKAKARERKSTESLIMEELIKTLKKNALKLGDLFKKWDEDGDGEVNRKEWHKAIPLIGISTSKDHIDRLFDYFDQDGSGAINYDELRAALKNKRKPGGSSGGESSRGNSPAPARKASPQRAAPAAAAAASRASPPPRQNAAEAAAVAGARAAPRPGRWRRARVSSDDEAPARGARAARRPAARRTTTSSRT